MPIITLRKLVVKGNREGLRKLVRPDYDSPPVKPRRRRPSPEASAAASLLARRRAKALTPERRREIAELGGRARVKGLTKGELAAFSRKGVRARQRLARKAK